MQSSFGLNASDAAPFYPANTVTPPHRQGSPELYISSAKRPYPSVQRRSFRDVSSSADVFVQRSPSIDRSQNPTGTAGGGGGDGAGTDYFNNNVFATDSARAASPSPMWNDSTRVNSSSSGSSTGMTRAASTPGVIGQGRKSSFVSSIDGSASLSASPDKTIAAATNALSSSFGAAGSATSTAISPWSQSPNQTAHSPLPGGLDAIWDNRTALGLAQAFGPSATSPGDSTTTGLRSSSSATTTPVKSRPSSFILDILPTQTDQARERAAQVQAQQQQQSFGSNSLSLTVDTSNRALSIPSSSRASSPSPSPAVSALEQNGTSTQLLEARVALVEHTVGELANVVHTQIRVLRDELAAMRSVVAQMQPQTVTASQQQQRKPSFSGGAGPVNDPDQSPLLTLRSPSPPPPQSSAIRRATSPSPSFWSPGPSIHQQQAVPSQLQQQQQHQSLQPTMQQPHGGHQHLPAQQMIVPPSPALSTPGVNSPAMAQNDDLAAVVAAKKDEQIRVLTAQVAALSSSVASLMQSTQGIGLGRPPNGAQQQQQQASGPGPGQMQRQASGNSAMGLGLGGGGSNNAGGGQGYNGGMYGAGAGMARGLSATSTGAGPTVNGPGGGSMSRQASWAGPNTGVGNASDNIASGGVGGGAGSNNGTGGAGGSGGSLGGKWEALGVGSDLFRAVAKYGLGPPTKIQIKAIPCVLRGQDVIAQAAAIQERIQAYVIPALQVLLSAAVVAAAAASSDGSGSSPSPMSILAQQPNGIQVIIVTATVDQAAQAQRLTLGLGASFGVRTALCVGAVPSNTTRAEAELRADAQQLASQPLQPHVLVGTPHKLRETLALGLVSLKDVRLLVIDECDQLLARNLAEHVSALVRMLPPSIATGAGSGIGGNASVSGTSSSSASTPLLGVQSTSPVIARSPLLNGGGGPNGVFDAPVPQQLSPSIGSASGVGRQTAIFSCTVPQDVLTFASSLQLRDQVRVLVRRDTAGAGAGSGAGSESILPSSTSSGGGGPGTNGNNGIQQGTANYQGHPNGSAISSSAGGGGMSLRGIKQFYVYIAIGSAAPSSDSAGGGSGGWKLEAVADLCEEQSYENAIVFCSSIENVEAVSYKLGTRAVECLALDMGPASRNAVMAKFRAPHKGKKVLVVLGSLSRSLVNEGMSQVSLVVNYDLPRQIEDYLHRVTLASVGSSFGGPRSNQGQGQGVAINFVTPGADVDLLRSIEAHYRCKIHELPPNFA